MRQLSLLDQVIHEFDTGLRALFVPEKRTSKRNTPGQKLEEASLSSIQKRHVAGLMRVNHSGEVCAQALYQGQAMTAKLEEVRTQMEQAAEEEIDHLAWCEQRLNELGRHPSILNPLWYCGSFMIGALAGLAGDKWSLGFVAETEKQVTSHLQKHLQKTPSQDLKTKAILAQMQEDEMHHADAAIAGGAAELPAPVRQLMGLASNVMTKSSYYI